MPNQEDRLARIEALNEQTAANLAKLTGVVDALASSVVAHDEQIEQLLALAEKHNQAIANLERQWQAYLSTIHPKQ
jgi:hypothetical protein